MVVCFVGILTKIDTFSTSEKYTIGVGASRLVAFLCSRILTECVVPLQAEKKLLTAETFPHCVGIFSLNTEHFDKTSLPLQKIQTGFPKFSSTVVVETKTLLAALVFDGSSTLCFPGLCFIF